VNLPGNLIFSHDPDLSYRLISVWYEDELVDVIALNNIDRVKFRFIVGNLITKFSPSTITYLYEKPVNYGPRAKLVDSLIRVVIQTREDIVKSANSTITAIFRTPSEYKRGVPKPIFKNRLLDAMPENHMTKISELQKNNALMANNMADVYDTVGLYYVLSGRCVPGGIKCRR
jgi:hypothetical protein